MYARKRKDLLLAQRRAIQHYLLETRKLLVLLGAKQANDRLRDQRQSLPEAQLA